MSLFGWPLQQRPEMDLAGVPGSKDRINISDSDSDSEGETRFARRFARSLLPFVECFADVYTTRRSRFL